MLSSQSSSGLAMVFHRSGLPFEAREFKLPTLATGELLVKVDYATICGSDLKTFKGDRQEPTPCILGHEMVGRIVGMEGVHTDYFDTPLSIGDRISWSIYAFDPKDEYAQKGWPQKSRSLIKYGHRALHASHSLSGGYAEYCHLMPGTTLVKIPDFLNDQVVSPLNCAVATVAGGFRLLGDCRGKSVLIYGCGMLGIMACAMARKRGAKWIGVVDLKREKLSMAKRFGADAVFQPTDVKPDQLDLFIDLTGVPNCMEEGLQKLDIGGTALLLGATYPSRNLSVNAEVILRKILTIKGLHNYAPEDLGAAYEFLKDSYQDFPYDLLIQKEFPLRQLDEAFAFALQNPVFRVGIAMGRSEI